MNPILEYLLKANALITFFGLFYYISLKKETFYETNRWYFITAILLSLVIPIVTFTKTIWIKTTPQNDFLLTANYSENNFSITESGHFFWQTIDLASTIVYLILTISLIMLLRKIWNVMKLYRDIKKMPSTNHTNIKISEKSTLVYSFYRWIVVPKSFFEWKDHELILKHENIHIQQKHSFDLIFIELLQSAFWFNPFIRIVQRYMNSNLEYIVDQKMVAITEPVQYQKNLLQFQSVESVAFVNSYNSSEIRNRIIQINTKKSRKMNKLKLVLTVPVITLFFMFFQIKTIAQVEQNKTAFIIEKANHFPEKENFQILIYNGSDDEYFEDTTKKLKEDLGIDIKFLDIKRNADGLIKSLMVYYANDDLYVAYTPNAGEEVMESTFISVIYENGKYYLEMPKSKNTKKQSEEIIIGQKNYKNEKPVVYFTNDVQNKSKIKEGESIIHIKGQNTEKQASITSQEENEKSILLRETNDLLYILNGKEISKKDFTEIDPQEIKSINVLKDKIAIEKYGKKAENGVLEIFTKEHLQTTISMKKEELKKKELATKKRRELEEKRAVIEKEASLIKEQIKHQEKKTTQSTPKELKKAILSNTSLDYKTVYLQINGKEAKPKQLEKLSPNKIGTVIFQNGHKSLVDQYGEKTKNGIILLETKKGLF